MQQSFRKRLVALSVMSVMGTLPMIATAQQADDNAIEEVVVSGFRGSLLKAMDKKKEALGSQDTILAEDIADFPSLNLAESIQRIPGVTITREAGEGRQISLRGLNADFTQVQLNGMEALGTSSSPMDSRGTVNTSRSFDFNIFASELFNQIDVQKSYSAEMDEGGIGGTVKLYTAKPFDYEGFKSVISAQAGDNSLTDDTSPRIAALVSNTWDKFGALVSIAYSKRDTSEQGYNTYRWRPRDAQGSDISALSAADQAAVESGDLRFSRGSRYSLFNSEQTRMGATLALQYRPNDDLSFDFDALYGELKNDRGEFHLQSRGSSSTALGCTGPDYDSNRYFCSSLTALEYNANNEVIYSQWQDTAIHSESRDQGAKTKVSQLVLSGEWDVNFDLKLSGLVGHMKSDYDSNSAKVYLESFGDMTIDYRQDRFYGTNTYQNGYDPTNIDEFRYHEIDLAEDEVSNSFDTAKLDADYAINNSSSLKVGVSYKSFEHDNNSVQAANEMRSAWQSGAVSDVIDSQLTYTNTGHKKQDWMSINVNGVLDEYGVNRNLTMSNTPNEVTEDTQSAYVVYDLDMKLADSELRASVGLRYFDTDIKSTGLVNGSDYVTVKRGYDGFLPTLNLAWYATENLVIRGSAGKNVTRPTLGSLSVSGTVNTDPLVGSSGLNISAGNPALQPFETINMEAGVEYYFDEVGYASVTYFRKDIDNFIATRVAPVAYGDTGYPMALIDGMADENGNPQTAQTIYTFSQPQNLEDSDFSGWEVALQRDFDFLPAPFDKLGAIANYTYADGESLHNILVDGETVSVYRPFYGLSENTYNATLYYETDVWGARVSLAHRDDYLTQVETSSNDQDEAGFHGTTYWDFSAFYNISDNLKVSLEGINLSNEREEQYSDSDNRLYNTTISGRTFYLGVTYSM
ncbi:TonB-dependent receptor [Alteromonas lipolytica]|uniref:TonB-dependent receptor n=1 Tax=Alteromonas lipolytica TaxID=1856405 RepID=A0A1E8F8P1_9ALTE|nr:TonB-dependent receptor [Alteromonas lipolytica]OFI32282.1 TonB-dependent receptor [Alteromonas lipolytica]GGF85822.1 TonB-dependent receptor [Alteromonas lipolytica]